MARKLLQWLGGISVLLLLAAAIGALAVVEDRVRIVVQADAGDSGPEPVALLRDDVGVIARDVGGLRSALDASLERLGNALDERAQVRHADVAQLGREVAALREQVAAQAEAVRAIERRLASGAMSHPATTTPLVGEAAPGAEAAVRVESERAAVAAPPETPAAPAVKPRAFLSFTLPAPTFAFDREQTWQLLPELCRVGFDAKSTLHDFSGVTSKVRGSFTADFDDPNGALHGEVTCEAASLVTGVEGRDENMREHLAVQTHPQIHFAIDRFVPAQDGIDPGRQTVRGEVQGVMTIRGTSRQLRMPITVEIDGSRRAVVTGQAPLLLSDYGVPVPSQLGLIEMQDEVVVWIALRARVAVENAR